MIKKLGPNGMSGDESDGGCSVGRNKIPIRLQLPWLNEDMTKVLIRLDSHKPTNFLIAPRGNRPFERQQERKIAPPHLVRPVPNLPVNWYNTDWYHSLSFPDKLSLNADTETSIPVSEAPQLFNADDCRRQLVEPRLLLAYTPG